MRSHARPSLLDTIAFDDPLEMVFACHRRIEKQLETLKRLAAHLQIHGVDAEASAAAQSVLGYFRKAAVDHLEDEEHDLFPLLESRIGDDSQKERFRHFREETILEHREIEAIWSRIRRPLEGIADGLVRALPVDQVHAFASAYEHHIRAEESTLAELGTRWLDERDRATLSRAMTARRTAS